MEDSGDMGSQENPMSIMVTGNPGTSGGGEKVSSQAAEEWIKKVEETEEKNTKQATDKEVWAGLGNQTDKLSANELRRALTTAEQSSEDFLKARGEWQKRKDKISAEYEKVTGGKLDEYVKVKLVGAGRGATKEDREVRERALEFGQYLNKRQEEEIVMEGILDDERKYLDLKAEEKRDTQDWKDLEARRASVLPEDWDKAGRTKSTSGAGVEVKVKPIGEMKQEEREEWVDHQAETIISEGETKQEESGNFDWNEAAKQVISAAKYAGVALAVGEVIEEMGEYLKEKRLKHERVSLREFRELHEHKKVGKKSDTDEQDIKRHVETREIKGLSELSYVQLRDKISNLAHKLSKGGDKEMEDQLTILKEEKMARAMEISKKGFYKMTQHNLEQLINQVLSVSRLDNLERNLKGLASRADTEAAGIEGYQNDPRLYGLVYGVIREEIDAVIGEIYEGMSDSELEAKKIDPEINKKEMELLDRKRIGLVTIRHPGGLLNADLSDEEMDDIYKRNNIPGAEEAYRQRKAMEKAKKEEEEIKRQEEAVKQNEKNTESDDGSKEMELQNLKSMLATALVEGAWSSKVSTGDRERIRRWVAENGTHDEVSLIKAQIILVDWIQNVDEVGGVEAALNVKDFGSEAMEALEGNEKLLKAKRAILEATGFNMECKVSAEQMREAIEVLKCSDYKLLHRSGNGSRMTREQAKVLLFGGQDERGKLVKGVIDKSKDFIQRKDERGTLKNIHFWEDLKNNDYKLGVNKFLEVTAQALNKTDIEDNEVVLTAMTALRQIQHSGLWNTFMTSYSAHPFIVSDITRAMYPGDAYLAKFDTNDSEFMLEKGMRPGHYRLINSNRDWFIRRASNTGMYEMESAREVRGYEGMTWNELVLPPEALLSYAIDDAPVFAKKEDTLWDRWRENRLVSNRTEFFKMGPLFVTKNRRKGAMALDEMLWKPVLPEGVHTPGSNFLKITGNEVTRQLKSWGVLLGTAEEIYDNKEKEKNKDLISEVTRFVLSRGMIFWLDSEREGQLNIKNRKFSTKWLGMAMRGYEIVPGTERVTERTLNMFGDSLRDYQCRLREVGWGIDVMGDDGKPVYINLRDDRTVNWLENYAGMEFEEDDLGRFKEELITMMQKDNLAKALIGVISKGKPDEPIQGWGGYSIKQAWEKRRKIQTFEGRTKKTIYSGGLGMGKDNELKNYKQNEDFMNKTSDMRSFYR